MSIANIHGGLANRFEYYIGPAELPRIHRPRSGDRKMLDAVHKQFNLLRLKFTKQTRFEFTPDADEYLSKCYDILCDMSDDESNPILESAYGRLDTQLRKNALLFAALDHRQGDDGIITVDHMVKSWELQRYLILSITYVYGQFVAKPLSQLEMRIIDLLKKEYEKSKSGVSRNVLANTITKTHDITEFDKVFDSMVLNQKIFAVKKSGERVEKYFVKVAE